MIGVARITQELLAIVSPDVRDDLATEDPAVAVEFHFPPLRVRRLPLGEMPGDACSVDGYYETNVDPQVPWILFSDAGVAERARFTVLHEVGHHLLVTDAQHLIDDIDKAAGSSEKAVRLEEQVCHRFAGSLLIADDLLNDVVGDEPVRPRHVVELHARTHASWEAVAIRASERILGPGAVVLVSEGLVRFCAAGGGFASRGWPRRSLVNPTGPLHKATSRTFQSVPETFRWNLPYAEQAFCDTMPVHDGLGIGVLTTRATDRHFEILEEPEPTWKRESFCEWCSEERTEGWCDRCKGRHCPECHRCACEKPVHKPVCSECGLQKPFRPGAALCVDCEDD